MYIVVYTVLFAALDVHCNFTMCCLPSLMYIVVYTVLFAALDVHCNFTMCCLPSLMCTVAVHCALCFT